MANRPDPRRLLPPDLRNAPFRSRGRDWDNQASSGGWGGGVGNFGGGGFGGGGGMDPWQQSVENRIGKIEDRLGAVETQLATLVERVSHLPTKTWMGLTAVGIVGALTGAIGYAEKIQGFFNP